MAYHTSLIFIISMVTIWYPMVTAELEPINEDNLDPEAAHVCQSTQQEPYTALESFVQYYQTKTSEVCWGFPPLCTKYGLATRIAYRVATRYRSRKSYFCCEGYRPKAYLTYCVPKCAEDCNSHLGQGHCVLPNECVCREGWSGTTCQSSCPEGTWGTNCTKSCTCSATGSCDPITGSCICHIGYTGQDCSTPCTNSFGQNCVHRCVCENNSTCDNINGICTCQPGYYGAYCHKVCEPGSTPEECQQICQCQNGGTCDENLKCTCKPGYYGDYCTEECDDFHWGQNCSNLCSCESGKCNHKTGHCLCHIGYAGDSCEIQCKPGTYGYNCSTLCPCKNGGQCYYGNNGRVECNCAGTGFNGSLCTDRVCKTTQYIQPGTSETCIPCQCPWDFTDSCNPKTGICDCKAGYHGAVCEQSCSMPFWGKNCLSLCKCANGDCDFITGECSRCYKGFIGDKCDQPCPQGTWGENCQNDCQCVNGAECRADTGYCNCTDGFYGLNCQDFCPSDRFGPGCQNKCTCNSVSALCNPYTGQCQCKSGFSGVNCEAQCDEWKFGFQCQQPCSCNKAGTQSCNHQTGECSCKPGWKGVSCDSECTDDFWGAHCRQPCTCHPFGSCDQNTGKCRCYPGYHGNDCKAVCPAGFYGANCSVPCPACYDGTVCNFITGECTPQTCPPGLTGQECNQVCEFGSWGPSCGQACSSTCLRRGLCNPFNGKCVCQTGYTGDQCDFEDKTVVKGQTGSDDSGSNPGPMVGLGILAVALIVALIAVTLCFLRRQKRQEKLRNEMSVQYGNGTVHRSAANGTAAGVVNPTYEEENIQNQLRFPRLEQRATLPPPPRRTCEEFDEIADEKLRVDLGPVSRPTSGSGSRRTSNNYDDVDETRYTTLGSVMGAAGNSEIGIPNWKSNKKTPHKRASNDYTFYMGSKNHQDQGAPPRAERGSRGYANTRSTNDTRTNPNGMMISSPLYTGNHGNSSLGSPDASLSTQSFNTALEQSSSNPDQTSGNTNTLVTNRKEVMANDLPSNENPNNPYDVPDATRTPKSPQNNTLGGYITPTSGVTGYLTPANNVTNPYENEVKDMFVAMTTDRNQNKVPTTMNQSDASTPGEWENFEEINEANSQLNPDTFA